MSWQTRRQWAESLVIGQTVQTNYPDVQQGYRKATVQNVVLGAISQSGILIKLAEVPEELDLFWIMPDYPAQ